MGTTAPVSIVCREGRNRSDKRKEWIKVFWERCGFVYLAEMRTVFSPAVAMRMTRRRRCDAVYHVGDTDTVLKWYERPGARFAQLCYSSSLLISLAFLSSQPFLYAVKFLAISVQGRASFSHSPSLPYTAWFLPLFLIPAFFRSPSGPPPHLCQGLRNQQKYFRCAHCNIK